MAKATPKTKTVTKMVPTEVTVNDGVTLELSALEAKALHIISRMIGGLPRVDYAGNYVNCGAPGGILTVRGHMDAIQVVLRDSGVDGADCCDEYTCGGLSAQPVGLV